MRFPKMADESTNFRLEIRHRTKPFDPYFWEIFSVSNLKRVKRSSRTYPTRGAAMKAGKKALLRLMVPPHRQFVAKPQRERETSP